MIDPTDEAYEIAAEEYEDDEIDRGLYERLYVEVDGDRGRARAAYIHRRAQDIQNGYEQRCENALQQLIELEADCARAKSELASQRLKVIARECSPFVMALVGFFAGWYLMLSGKETDYGWFWWVSSAWYYIVTIAISGAMMSVTAIAIQIYPKFSIYERYYRDIKIARALLGKKSVDSIHKDKYISLAQEYGNAVHHLERKQVEKVKKWLIALGVFCAIITLAILLSLFGL